MKTLSHVERRVRAVLKLFDQHGPMTSAMLAEHLGLPSPEAPIEGRKLRHVLGDLSLSDWITRTGHRVKHGNRSLPVFQLTPDGREHLQSLFVKEKTAPVYPPRLNGLSALLKQARPVARPSQGAGYFQPVSRTVPAPEKPAALPAYPVLGRLPNQEVRLPIADKLSCLESSAAQRNSQDLKFIVSVLVELAQKVEKFERWLNTVQLSAQEVLPKEPA